MRPPARLVPLLLPLLGGCLGGTADRGLVSPHQPLVAGNRAFVAGCPDWRSAGLPAGEAQSSNFGCATAINLAAMIADPADLLHGRADGGGDPAVAAKAIRAWQDAPATSRYWKPQPVPPITDKLDPLGPSSPDAGGPAAPAAPAGGPGGGR